jgi:hypothetical protein
MLLRVDASDCEGYFEATDVGYCGGEGVKRRKGKI